MDPFGDKKITRTKYQESRHRSIEGIEGIEDIEAIEVFEAIEDIGAIERPVRETVPRSTVYRKTMQGEQNRHSHMSGPSCMKIDYPMSIHDILHSKYCFKIRRMFHVVLGHCVCVDSRSRLCKELHFYHGTVNIRWTLWLA